MRLPLRFIILLRGCALAVSLCAVAGISVAQSGSQPASAWIDAVRTLTARIASFTPQTGTLYLDFKNISSVDAAQAAAVRLELIAELGRRGFHLSTDSAANAQVEATLSESASEYLLVARVHRAEGDQVAVAAGPSRNGGAGGPGGDTPTLARKTVWEQRRPILDFANLPSDSAGATPLLLLVQPDALTVYAKPGAQWVTAENAPLRHPSPWPRDLRAWIDLNNRKIELPGLECTGDLAKPAAMQCAAASASGKFPRGLDQLPLAAPAANGRESGDGLLLDLNCGGGRVALVTGSGDWTEPDSIQAFELKDDVLVASGDPLPFAGPVLSLWPSADLKSARVVARNLRTGMYEASIVSVTCGN
jgi:hypothetical protein